MAKIAILETDGFEEAELIHSFYRLKETGHNSELISLGKRPIERKFGYDGVIIPEGPKNPDHLRRNKGILSY